jgi:hypothetical protein
VIGGTAAATERYLANPLINGMHVDRCLFWGQQCDEPAATAFCRSQGLSRATNWNWAYMAPTLVQGDGKVCNNPSSCGGFTLVACEPAE